MVAFRELFIIINVVRRRSIAVSQGNSVAASFRIKDKH